jgi:hypothetical protein
MEVRQRSGSVEPVFTFWLVIRKTTSPLSTSGKPTACEIGFKTIIRTRIFGTGELLFGGGRKPLLNSKLCTPITARDTRTDLSVQPRCLWNQVQRVRPGDLLWVEHGGKRSRFKVVWVRDSESQQLIQAAVHRVDTEPCPWAEL